MMRIEMVAMLMVKIVEIRTIAKEEIQIVGMIEFRPMHKEENLIVEMLGITPMTKQENLIVGIVEIRSFTKEGNLMVGLEKIKQMPKNMMFAMSEITIVFTEEKLMVSMDSLKKGTKVELMMGRMARVNWMMEVDSTKGKGSINPPPLADHGLFNTSGFPSGNCNDTISVSDVASMVGDNMDDFKGIDESDAAYADSLG
ncbi:unnamed protein product [Calypogeia fissa]